MISWLISIKGEFIPSARSLALVWIAVGILGLGMVCLLGGLLYAFSGNPPPGVGVILGIFFCPLVCLALVIAALREPRHSPRIWMWGGAALMASLSGAAVAIEMALDPETGLATGAAAAVFCAPVVIVLLIPAFYNLTQAWPELKHIRMLQRSRRATEMILGRGQVRFAELAAELQIPLDQVDNLLERMQQERSMDGLIDIPNQRVYSPAFFKEKQQQLLALVQVHGQIRMDDLGRELDAPDPILKLWISQLVQNGQFSGYLNMQERMLYSSEARALRDRSLCPKCGGQLALVGRGVIQCQLCGT